MIHFLLTATRHCPNAVGAAARRPVARLAVAALVCAGARDALAQGASTDSARRGRVDESEDARFRVEVVASGLRVPWGLAFLPDGRALVTERPVGRLGVLDLRSGTLALHAETRQLWEHEHGPRGDADRSWRVRVVQQGADGLLYVGVDSGMILRIRPE